MSSRPRPMRFLSPRKLPAYRIHSPTGQAVVESPAQHPGWQWRRGALIYLGTYDSPKSHERYRELVREWVKLWLSEGYASADRPGSINSTPSGMGGAGRSPLPLVPV